MALVNFLRIYLQALVLERRLGSNWTTNVADLRISHCRCVMEIVNLLNSAEIWRILILYIGWALPKYELGLDHH